jgi:hypothetical protein
MFDIGCSGIKLSPILFMTSLTKWPPISLVTFYGDGIFFVPRTADIKEPELKNEGGRRAGR